MKTETKTVYIDDDGTKFADEKECKKYENSAALAYKTMLEGVLTPIKGKIEIDEKHKIGKWFTGLIPCWIDAPSTLQAAHDYHGKNIVAIHLKNGGYRCCCVDDKKPTTFSLAENTPLVEGWHNRESSWDEEDEKIRKMLIGWINLEPSISFGDTFDGFSKEQIIAWLEKQGK